MIAYNLAKKAMKKRKTHHYIHNKTTKGHEVWRSEVSAVYGVQEGNVKKRMEEGLMLCHEVNFKSTTDQATSGVATPQSQ